jgi:hypothetical protein
LPSRKTYSTGKTRSSIERTVVSKKTESNNYKLYRYCTSTAVQQLTTVKQQHTATANSILTTKSTYCSLSAQRLFESTVFTLNVLEIHPTLYFWVSQAFCPLLFYPVRMFCLYVISLLPATGVGHLPLFDVLPQT